MSKKIVLITGGNNGIGLETCGLFAEQPDVHVIMASRSLDKGQEAISIVKKRAPQGSISLVQLDINSDASIAAAVKQVTDEHGHIDTLINNAGICPTDKEDRALMNHIIETNAVSPALVTQAFAPLLMKSADPRLIYVTSVMGSVTSRLDKNNRAYESPYKTYRVSKAAVNMMVACDAWELGKDGVRVFAYCPGYVISDLGGERSKKESMGIPGPEKSALGLLGIHQGKEDKNADKLLHSLSVVEGAPTHPW